MKWHRVLPCALCLLTVLCLGGRTGLACTIFMASKDGRTLVGNNEDWRDPGTNIWIIPASPGKYGRLYFGFGVGLAQGGVNEKGLFFDFAAVSPKPFVPSPGKKQYAVYLVEKLMEECGTVEEALSILSAYDFPLLSRAQIMLVDRTGASAIVESGGIFRKEHPYQVMTNFRQSADQGDKPGIERFRIAERMLADSAVTVENFRAILNATHQEGDSPTQYSTVFDLPTGDIYIYHFHNYLEVTKLNVRDELAKGEHACEIRSLFRDIPFAADHYAYEHRRKERTAITVNPAGFAVFVGDYQIAPGIVLTVSTTADGKTLQAQIIGFPIFPVYPEEPLKFFCKAMDMQLTFAKNDSGTIDSVIMSFAGGDSTAKRIR